MGLDLAGDVPQGTILEPVSSMFASVIWTQKLNAWLASPWKILN